MEQCASLDCQWDPRYSIPRAEVDRKNTFHGLLLAREVCVFILCLAIRLLLSQKDSFWRRRGKLQMCASFLNLGWICWWFIILALKNGFITLNLYVFKFLMGIIWDNIWKLVFHFLSITFHLLFISLVMAGIRIKEAIMAIINFYYC